jgi:hypothetical protein
MASKQSRLLVRRCCLLIGSQGAFMKRVVILLTLLAVSPRVTRKTGWKSGTAHLPRQVNLLLKCGPRYKRQSSPPFALRAPCRPTGAAT